MTNAGFKRAVLTSPFSAYQQKRTFLGLRRPPAPKTPMMGYLVAQGLAIVLVADLAIAMVQNKPTTIRSVCQSAGFWKDQEFRSLHGKGSIEVQEGGA